SRTTDYQVILPFASTVVRSQIPCHRLKIDVRAFPYVFPISVSANLQEGDAVDGSADMGGTQGWGPAHPPLVDEPVFGEAWEGRAFALALLSTRVAGWNLDAFRHALERLSRAAYLDDGYFGRWFNAAELVLTDSAVLAPEAVEARVRILRGQIV